MKRREWDFVDKSKWGAGAWANEPDKVQWVDEETGLPCLVVRHPNLGHLCGYVGVAEGHPLHGVDYSAGRASDIGVHGGLTFADRCTGDPEGHTICHVADEGEPDKVWWFGFDCAHLGDLSPGMRAREREMGWHEPAGDTYKPLGYVRDECRKLAAQLKAVGEGKTASA